MSIFAKPLSDVATADLQELLDHRAVENLRLEFKLQVPNRDETLKKITSFANTYGGFMVVGASASSIDGRIDGLPGVDEETGYKQKVVQWCFDAATPPLVVEVSDPIPVPSRNGKLCYVVKTAESDLAPHFLNDRKGIWVRTDEFSQRTKVVLADERELRHLFDRRRLVLDRRASILDRAKRRFDNYIAKMNTDLSGNRTHPAPRLEVSVVPRFPSRPICEQEMLKRELVARENVLPWRGVEFPRSTRAIVSQHESAIILFNERGLSSILEANIWGMLFYSMQIDQKHHTYSGIHAYQVVGYLLVFIRHATKMLLTMGYSGPIVIETNFASILNVPWLHVGATDGVVSTSPGSELDDDFGFKISTTTEELTQKPDRILMDAIRSVFFSANLSDLVDTQQKLEELLRKGYKFNSWSEPLNLQT